MADNIQQYIDLISSLSEAKQDGLATLVNQRCRDMKWLPNPGPQTSAYFSDADVLLYGGAGGGGKSDLGLGLAITSHQRSLVMRRKYADLAFLTDRSVDIVGSRKGFSGSAPPRFKFEDKLIEFGAAQYVGDELSWMGRPHDLLYIDEAAHFVEKQIRNLMGWVRSTTVGQRVRVVLGSNPPLSDEGSWMFVMFAPWLDPAFENPAKAGELRWCIINDEDQDVWVDGPGLYDKLGNFISSNIDIEMEDTAIAMSRTFIPAKLADNPYQNTAAYRAQQDGLPKRMRDAIRDGNFLAVRNDHHLQVIPTDWIIAAMDRWTNDPPAGVPMCCVSADLTGMGGEENTKRDNFVIARRYDGWYSPLIAIPGQLAKLGADKAGQIISVRRDGAKVVLDMGGGYGDSTHEHLTSNGVEVVSYKGSEKSLKKSTHSKLEYYNKRAEIYCRFMEALDPSQPGGSHIKLPKDELLRADLCSIRYDESHADLKVLKLEPKKRLVARYGRSTDYSDPVVVAWAYGPKMSTHYHEWKKGGSDVPKVITKKK